MTSAVPAITLSPRDYDAVLFDLDGVLTRDALRVRGRDGAAAPISLCVGDKVCEFVSGTTRVFRLNEAARDGGIAEEGRGQ